MKKMLFFIMVLFAQVSSADWVLNEKKSVLNFVTTKNAAVTESHTFKKIAGSIDAEGTAKLVINLASVETGVPIRNDRMKEMLFETARFPEANVELKIDKKQLEALKAGEIVDQSVKAILKLHGISESIDAKLRAVKLANNGLIVTTVEPIVLNTDLFGLKEGVEKLRDIVKLQSITGTVPVVFNLIFDEQ